MVKNAWLSLLAELATVVLAHGPTPQKSDHEITFQAQFAEVWEKIKFPGSLCTWHPVAVRCEVNGNQRTIELKNGERFSEDILEVDE